MYYLYIKEEIEKKKLKKWRLDLSELFEDFDSGCDPVWRMKETEPCKPRCEQPPAL